MERIFETNNYSLQRTLTCGQCFRFSPCEQGFTGVMGSLVLYLSQEGSTVKVTGDFTDEDVPSILSYFALEDDYSKINELLSQDPTLGAMVKEYGDIRIMNQPFWETLASFIISQNNNIPRIAGIIERFCLSFGKKKDDRYMFPEPRVIASLTEEELGCLRCGYRAPYLIDAAVKYSEGLLKEDDIRTLPLEEARKLLMTVKGVGPKVADCTLLFGAHRLDAFPRDVWIKRAMAHYFPDGLPEFAAPYAGIAQQYLFHYARTKGFE